MNLRDMMALYRKEGLTQELASARVCQDYHGKRIDVAISDQYGTVIKSKIDIGVHKHLEIEQEEYYFDVCMDEEGACLLKNTAEQSFVEKLRSLLIFGVNSRRYKDIYDMFYLKEMVHDEKLRKVVDVLVFKDSGMRENSMDDICKRISAVFKDKQYLSRVSSSRQRWLDGDIHDITDGILNYLERLKKN